jgi:hypothetical protein
MRGREKRSRMTNEVVANEAMTIIIVRGGIDGQIDRVWRAGPRHDPFNSVWTNPTRASCDAWVVASAQHDYFFYFTKKSYIYRECGFKLHLLHRFLTYPTCCTTF